MDQGHDEKGTASAGNESENWTLPPGPPFFHGDCLKGIIKFVSVATIFPNLWSVHGIMGALTKSQEMTNYSVKSVDAYISKAPSKAQGHLRQIRSAVKSAVPKAEEGLSYGKPYYRHHGMLAGFDAYKNHIGFEIWTDKLEGEYRKSLEEKGYKTGTRTFNIGYDQEVPTALIKKMVKERAKRNEAKDKE